MSWLLERARRDPGATLLVLALIGALALYAPTLGMTTVNLDDPWLVENNAILSTPSVAHVRTVLTDFSPDTRFVLGAEYLPVRDLSIMADRAVWGDNFGGFHVTNLVLYLAAIALWFFAFVQLGIDRTLAGVAILLWALHPTHAESVAWLAERKGLLGLVWTGAAVLGYARWRHGDRRLGSLVLAAVSTVFAVWSKAPSAFAIAALAPIELLAPRVRASTKRSLVGLAVLAVVGLAAFAPVVHTASAMAVVGSSHDPVNRVAMVLGLHGFYVQLAAMLVANAVSYPVATIGPGVAQIVVGAAALLAVLAAAVVRLSATTREKASISAEVAIGAWLWLLGWFPISRLALPLRNVLAADRYLSFATLGFTLALAAGALRVPRRLGIALIAVVALASFFRACDARSNWAGSEPLWERAIQSNPDDGDAWVSYSELVGKRDPALARQRAEEGYARTKSQRILMRLALLSLGSGDIERGKKQMRDAADGGEIRAQANLAVLLIAEHKYDEAAQYARRATTSGPFYAKGHQALGNAELALGHVPVAISELRRAHELDPADVHTGCDLGIALAQGPEAKALVQPCAHEPRYADRVSPILGAP